MCLAGVRSSWLTFEQSKVPERTAVVQLLSPCPAGSHCWCWSHSAFSPPETSVRRSVVGEEYLTTNIHHSSAGLSPLVLKSSLASCSSQHSPRPLHFQVGTFSVERRPLDTAHQSELAAGSRGRWGTNGRPWPPGHCSHNQFCHPANQPRPENWRRARIYPHNARLMILTKSNGPIVLLSPESGWQQAKNSISNKSFSPKRSSNNKDWINIFYTSFELQMKSLNFSFMTGNSIQLEEWEKGPRGKCILSIFNIISSGTRQSWRVFQGEIE